MRGATPHMRRALTVARAAPAALQRFCGKLDTAAAVAGTAPLARFRLVRPLLLSAPAPRASLLITIMLPPRRRRTCATAAASWP